MNEDILRAMNVKARYAAGLLQKPNVLGIGVGFRQQADQLTDEVVIVVNVSRKLAPDQLEPQDVIPSVIEGVPVDVRETGNIQAL